jgi:hypothetical protein
MKYNRDMTYIMMEAVNEWTMKREGINLAELSSNDDNNGRKIKIGGRL